MGLSGRQREHGRECTAEGLLAGLWVLLAVVAVWEQMPVRRVRELGRF